MNSKFSLAVPRDYGRHKNYVPRKIICKTNYHGAL